MTKLVSFIVLSASSKMPLVLRGDRSTKLQVNAQIFFSIGDNIAIKVG